MRFSTTTLVSLAATASALPAADPPKTVVGRACTGTGYSSRCTDLFMTKPNKCVTAISGALPYDRTIASIQIEASQPCAFFTLEACINPAANHAMVAQGPINIDSIPSTLASSIQAYLCGADALIYTGNQTLNAGSVVVNGALEAVKEPETQDVLEARDVGVSIGAEAIGATIATTLDLPPSSTGAGTIIYRYENLTGTAFPSDQTIIPGNAYCTDLDKIFPVTWDRNIRSFVVRAGYTCEYYTSQCTNAKSTPYISLGSKDAALVVDSLPPQFDEQLRAVWCDVIS